MTTLKFYALCCRNLHALKRHKRFIPVEDLVVVFNSPDEDFIIEGRAWCISQGIEHYVTICDGTPSTGKNAVLDIFEKSDNDFMCLIDGDDFLTPHGVWTYKQLVASGKCPDALALEFQWGIYAETGYDHDIRELLRTQQDTLKAHAGSPLIGTLDKTNPDTVHGNVGKPFYRPDSWWRDAMAGRIIRKFEGDQFSHDFCDCYTDWATLCYKYLSKRESHLRLVLFSKKIAESGYRFDPEYKVGEDTIMYLDIKRGHVDGDVVLKHLFDRYPTYIYDQRVGGVCVEERHKGGPDIGWYGWLSKLVDKYKEYEAQGVMSEQEIERINVRTYVAPPEPDDPPEDMDQYDIIWPDNYKPDVCSLVTYPGAEVVWY